MKIFTGDSKATGKPTDKFKNDIGNLKIQSRNFEEKGI